MIQIPQHEDIDIITGTLAELKKAYGKKREEHPLWTVVGSEALPLSGKTTTQRFAWTLVLLPTQ